MALWVDDLQEIDESNEDDNVNVRANPVVIEQGARPDLAVDTWYAQWDGNGDGSLTYEVANLGNVSAPGGWDINLMLSLDEDITADDIYLYYDTVTGELQPNRIICRSDVDSSCYPPGSFNLYADAFDNPILPDTYFMAVFVDDLEKVDESNELNNASLGWNTIPIGLGSPVPLSESTAAPAGGGRSYNGKNLPRGPVLVQRVRISDGADGKRELQVLDEKAGSVRTKAREPGAFAKSIGSTNTVVFPVDQAIPMPAVH